MRPRASHRHPRNRTRNPPLPRRHQRRFRKIPPAAKVPESAAFKPQPKSDFQITEGFKVQLFAENPQLAKPIQINFDPQGRLWVASSSVYPQIQPGQIADDKLTPSGRGDFVPSMTG